MYNCQNETSTDCCRRDSYCLLGVGAFFAALFLLVSGAIIGAYLSATILGSIAAFIVLDVVLLILTVAVFWLYGCRRRRR